MTRSPLHGSRARRIVSVALTAGLVVAGLGAGTAAAPSISPADAAVPAATATTSVVTVKTGGDRTGVSGVTPLPGVQLGLFSAVTSSDPVNPTWAVCTADAAGDCSFTVPDTQTGGANVNARFFVKQISAPSGWYANGVVRTQTSSGQTPVATPYAFQTPQMVAGTVYRSGTGASTTNAGFMSDPTNRNTTPLASGGVWQQSRINPGLAGCGLSVALILDVSGSVGANLPDLQGAGRALVNSLVGTPSDVSLYTFSNNSPANTTGNQNRPRTAVSTQAGADAVNGWISGTTVGGGTNWDRGLAQVAENEHHYDIAMMITDGNPTFYGLPPNPTWYPNNPEYAQGPGSATRAREFENGVFSANALKAEGTRVVAVGVGPGITSAAENLAAISGRTVNSDYYLTSDYAAAGAALRAQALSKCKGSVSVVSQLIPAGGTAANATVQPGWIFGAAVPEDATVTPGTGTTDDTGGTTFTVGAAPGSANTPVTITDQVPAGATVVQQNGANAACRDLSTGAAVSVTNQGATGFQVDTLSTSSIGCTVLHQAGSATATTVTAPASTRVAQPITVSAAVTPIGTGSVRFAATATSGPSTGSTVAIGTAMVAADGTAALSWTPPGLGAYDVTATYLGDSTHLASTSPVASVSVLAQPGSLVVSEFRQSGPGGATDGYVVLTNTGTSPIPLVGYQIVTGSGTTVPLAAASGTVAPGRSHLVAAAGYSLTSTTPADTTVPSLGSGGLKVVAPDPATTATDAVGPLTGPHSGTALPALAGSPTQQYAWVRLRSGGNGLQNTGDNVADFALVSSAGGPVGGVPSMIGAPSPIGDDSPAPTRAAPSTLLAGAADVAASPNRIVTRTPGGATTLTVNRVVTNRSAVPITAMRVRLTSISEANGIPRPGVTRPASLVVAPPSSPTTTFDVGGQAVTVQNLSPTAPVLSTGGLNTTYSVPLPNGRLDPGQSVPVSFTFLVQSGGTFWFSYVTEVS
ncbi:hypothetical protein FDO65_19435 [Nakamurella flava]|uniref:VWA domain-containing protein n=1 Tax=Nakamurella flava TaxID=2576308 RepID=A0A4U6QAL1_9ACTN|nr:Ig-like domain repeat protein [Nakamurella flava]TKV56993.1 hypothetical protein FDO65_19435 [Nakamurella flava]